MAKALYSIGHGRRSWLDFVALLDQFAIDVVVDVRWKPGSRWCPWSNRRALESNLGARYVFDGARLGSPSHFGLQPIASADRHEDVADLERRIASGERVAILCSERSPASCHRSEIAHDVAIDELEVVDL